MDIFLDGEILVGSDGNRYKIHRYNADTDYHYCDKCSLCKKRTLPHLNCGQLLSKLFGKEIDERASHIKKKSCRTVFGSMYFIELENNCNKWKRFLNLKEDETCQ